MVGLVLGWDTQSKYFPKVTLCDFQIREPLHLRDSHRYTVQCVLPLNLFSQQVNINNNNNNNNK